MQSSDGKLLSTSFEGGSTYTYSRLTKLVTKKADGTIIASYTYTLDLAGNRTKVEEHSGRVVEYDYDDTHKLLKETISEPGQSSGRVISYTYDAVGNRLTKTDNGLSVLYQYDKNNRLFKEGDIIYKYDDNGNLIEKDGTDELIQYSYNQENRLIRAETTSAGVTIVVTYAYDARGNRVEKTIDGTLTTRYLVDENTDYAQVLEERDSTGSLRARYVYGHDLLSQTRDSVVSYYHPDGLGSTRTLTNSAQTVTDTYTYDAFGLLLAQTGTTDNSYLYRGEQFDHELGFYYLRARYMNPALGRFVTMDAFSGYSADPITLHKYLYANANPVTYGDPSGYFSIMETQIGQLIRGILDKQNQLMLIPKYRMMRGAITGAVSTMIEGWISGERISTKDVLMSALTGGIFAELGPIIKYVGKFIPTALLDDLCKLKYLVPVLGGVGLASDIKGVWEAIKQKDYDLALYRSSQVMLSIYELKDSWNSFACFTEDTLIYTKDGYKPIKDIEVGDEVYSRHIDINDEQECSVEDTGLVLSRVTNTFERNVHTLIDLKVQDEDGDEVVISGTPEHPFFVPAVKNFLPMGELREGTVLYTGDGALVTVVETTVRHGSFTVYNFEVEGTHNYYVSFQNGEFSVLVHNKCRRGTNWRNNNGKFHMDNNGRLTQATAKVELSDLGTGTGTNPSSRGRARSMGYPDDDAGHLIAKNLGGSGGVDYVVPQNKTINRGEFRKFEMKIAKKVRNGHEVYIRVVPRYQGNSTRPYKIDYFTRIDGITELESFDNP